MSVFDVLNRADNNNKGALPQDSGTGLHPGGHLVGTFYGMVARIARIVKYRSTVNQGRLVYVELEDHPFPPGDPTQSTDPRRQNPVGLRVDESETGLKDYVAIAGVTFADGEHEIETLDGLQGEKSDRRLLVIDTVNPPNDTGTDYELLDTGWCYIADRSRLRNSLMDPARVISHPSFPQREGEGFYTYPFNPDVTKNFVYHPTPKVDAVVQRTISSNVLVAQPQLDEDVVISEIWLGGNRQLSTLSEMFRLFHLYWTTTPAAGETLGWEPRDRTGDRFAIEMVRVQLGGIDYEYNEVRQDVNRNKDSYLDQQLTVQFRMARRACPPRPSITMEGR